MSIVRASEAPTPGQSRRVDQLEQELLALGEESMLIEEFDGFVAGLLVCPELVLPGEWLPVVWGAEDGDRQSPFADIDHANRVLALIREHYNDIAVTLMNRPDRYGPLLPVDRRNGDIIWEIWIEGFEKAVALRPAAWQRLLDADAATAAAMRGLLTLVDVARDDRHVPRRERAALNTAAPEDIARWIVVLNAWRLANYRPAESAAATPRPPASAAIEIGRNDPCPCGSGKKYKRCCGFR